MTIRIMMDGAHGGARKRRCHAAGWVSGLVLVGVALCAAQAHETPRWVAQATQGSGAQTGGAAGGQFKHPESGATNPAGSSAAGPGDGQGQGRDSASTSKSRAGTGQSRGDANDMQGHHGNDTQPRSGNSSGGAQDSSVKGAVGDSQSAKGSAANSDKGPGHRGADTRPGH
ncbi:hypothetical protein CAL26_18335 [Bordetella genomosp. 9]|uniref:Uncharacterized protein n=1 Tax=Bordetella genomosp. 9 TaxID=1416803 RepID=A0A261R486_9BORD|nr:hypothetical protein [Bordetella genomosp. 9]OZI19567.1 hypothetical protein CAL26_18335 [Bordetella genomosp. 9]